MSWIKVIRLKQAEGKLKRIYNRIKTKDNYIDNILTAHSLRPHTLNGHMTLYKSVLHHNENKLPKWFLEAIGVLVSELNKCTYCVAHHYAGLTRLVGLEKAEMIKKALDDQDYQQIFNRAELEVVKYVTLLTRYPFEVTENNILRLREQGLDDGQILEINQVIAYFNYANRTVLGLGVNLEGDRLGLSPQDSGDPDNWNHL